jgi:hypothetical protein
MEVMSVVTVPLGHQIEDVKSIDSSNNSQNKLVCPDLFFDLFSDIVA